MFDNFTRAALLNAPSSMVLTTFVATPIQADPPADVRPATVHAAQQNVSTPAIALPAKRWRIPRFGLNLGTSA